MAYVFTKLADDWNALTEAEKIALFESTDYEVASVEDLATLGKFKVLMLSDLPDQQMMQVRAVPKPQLVLPRGLIPIDSFKDINKGTLLSNIGMESVVIEDRTWQSQGIGTVNGRFAGGRALNFPGNGYLEYPDNEDFNFGTDDFTISFWIKGSPVNCPSIINQKNTLVKLSGALNGNPFLQWSLYDYYVASQPILDETWNYVELIRENGIFELYKNGMLILQVRTKTADSFDLGIGGTVLGWDGYQSNAYLTAQVDDFKVVKGAAIKQESVPIEYIAPLSLPNIKIIVTTDNAEYQTYDLGTKTWKAIDYTDHAVISAYGIDAEQLEKIPRDAWDAVAAGKAGIGFAYLLDMEQITDTCEVDKLQMTVDMKGTWEKI